MIAAKQALDSTTRVKEDNRLTTDNAEKDLLQLEGTIESLQKEITSLRARFVGATDIEEAEKMLTKRDEENKIAGQRNAEEKVTAQEIMSSIEWSLLLESLNRTAIQITESDKNIKDSISLEERLKRRIEELEKTLSDMTPSDTSQSAEEKEQTIREVEVSVQLATTELAESRRQLEKSEEAATKLSRQHSEISRQLDALKARWTGAGLSSEPALDTWEKAKKDVADSMAGYETEIATVQGLQAELAKWGVAEELRQVDEDIDRVRGDLTISEHTEILSTSLRESQAKLDSIKERSSALNSFADKLRRKLEQLQEYLVAITEPWKELLHRVVLDPRFTDTTLSAYTRNNKQHAEVKVPLHGTNIAANIVASEAQITDLQFTFLLAMALNNQWTPWRGLLLDDPTQHHDLVHASSVFDLLRDYILDHQFQVLLATHDSVHAKFFLRKLQNDGIPANLIQLRAVQEGVIAELVTV